MIKVFNFDKLLLEERNFMKKLIICILGFICFYPIMVKAEDTILEEEYLRGIYFFQISKNGESYSHQEAIFHLGGKVAYCLQPDVAAKQGYYNIVEGLNQSILSEEQKQKVEEFGYYGYDYPGHQSINYYLAAQELIWEYVSEYEIFWSTRGDGNGKQINIEKEKQEILELIEKDKKLPSFANQEIKLYEKETLWLEDNNHVLDQFYIKNNHQIEIKNNYLSSNPLFEDMSIIGLRGTYDQEITLLYLQEDSQQMAFLRLSHPTSFHLNVKIEGTPVIIHKKGQFLDDIYNEKWENQDDVEFELLAEEDILGHNQNIIYKKGELIQKIITTNGLASTKKLPNGKFRLIETKSKPGYSKSKPIVFEINNSVEKSKIIEVKNYLSTGNLEIIKKNEDGTLLSKVLFGLYNKNMEKIDERFSNKSGKIIWQNIPIGEYYIKELKTQDGYVLDSDLQKITVTENETISVERINKKLVVPILPDTSEGKFRWKWFVGIIGLLFTKKIWRL